MPDTKPVQTRLTKQQLRILQFIYRFRHVSTKHITVFLGKAQIQQAQQRLNPLLKKKYIGRSYTNKDIQNNNYATYFLLPNGLRVLKQKDPEIDTDQLHLRRSDKTASDRFTTHNLRIGDVYSVLKQKYGNRIGFYTKTELMDFDYFPDPLPDAYISIDSKGRAKTKEYLLEVCDTQTPPFVYEKCIKYYAEYAKSEDWEDATDGVLPKILMVCETDKLRQKLGTFVPRSMEDVFRFSMLDDLDSVI